MLFGRIGIRWLPQQVPYHQTCVNQSLQRAEMNTLQYPIVGEWFSCANSRSKCLNVLLGQKCIQNWPNMHLSSWPKKIHSCSKEKEDVPKRVSSSPSSQKQTAPQPQPSSGITSWASTQQQQQQPSNQDSPGKKNMSAKPQLNTNHAQTWVLVYAQTPTPSSREGWNIQELWDWECRRNKLPSDPIPANASVSVLPIS